MAGAIRRCWSALVSTAGWSSNSSSTRWGTASGGRFGVVENSHPGFNLAAEEAIQRSLFRPARIHGNAVRQRAFQAIVFRITPE